MIDVVVAGAGPNGLMLACELALMGTRPLVLERLTEPTGEQRANGLVGQVVRMLDRRGLYERLTAPGARIRLRRVPTRPEGSAGQPALHTGGATAPDRGHARSACGRTGCRGPPGLNLGLQDAVNLGWKLAAELRGHAPEGLLDTYESERFPAARRVTMHTQAQSLLIRPGGDVTALRELFGELLAQSVTRQYIANLMSGADITYDMRPATGALVGRWAPDLPGLRELTRTGRPLLLDPKGTLDAGPWVSQVDTITVPELDAALLLRPDCYVAWQGTTGDGLYEALGTWFRAA